ncbi:mechanosensitive ion channel protein 6 [Daucus carota subsp. sativus]|uniref:Mechanosensitive ion channel protein n=2 Tax=Daucus carota subsp. sativus TaxID=79200 RepID=A0A162AGK0_DAUCS|nr:PREDICTED: mechanosensitive ion channel protein 6-like [Daucus carota subsp. sativus]
MMFQETGLMTAPSIDASFYNHSVGNDTVININESEIILTKMQLDSSYDPHFVTDCPAAHRSSWSEIPTSSDLYGQKSPGKVSFIEKLRRRGRHGGSAFSSNKSFPRESELVSMRSKSRLIDPPEQNDSFKRIMKSVECIEEGSDVHDDDPYVEEDFPEEFKMIKFSKWAVIQFFCMIFIIAALVCSRFLNIFNENKLRGLELWRWSLLLLALLCGRLVAGWVIRVVVFFVELNYMLRKRVLYFVYGLRHAVRNCIWLALILISWRFVLVDRVENLVHGKALNYVTKAWVCLLVGTLIWFVKTLFVKVLASSFHVSTFLDRIQDALFDQYVIETLSGSPLVEHHLEPVEEDQIMAAVPQLQNAGATVPPDLRTTVSSTNTKPKRMAKTRKSFPSFKSSRFSTVATKEEKEGITIGHLHRWNQKNISAWNMKRLMNIVKKGTLSTLDEQTGEDESAVQIRSETQAKFAAKKIFCNVAKPGSKHIYQEDLMKFMRDDEALKAITHFEGASGWKGISKKELKNWMVNTFRERRALVLSLNDTKKAVNKLHQMLNIFVALFIGAIWILILKVASIHFFVLLSSQLLLVVFVFGNTCKTMFEGIIFLFVMHPFDIGDRCEVDDVQLVVEEMNILTTTFLRYDNQKICYPNSLLSNKPISNYYRSPDMGDAIDFSIHISTPVEKIALMKEKITSYIEKNSDHWYPAPMIVLRDIEDMNRLKISLWLSHRINFQDMGKRWARRALVLEEMIKTFKELDIEYRMVPLDMNVRSMPAMASNRLPSVWTSHTN